MICDDSKAHLFFTSNNGLMWRAETPLSEFPSGWSRPVIVLRGDIFEASHTYRLKGENKFLTIVEAQAASRDRKSTRLNSSHEWISYAVFCLKKKKKVKTTETFI